MHIEVQVALNFVISYLYNKLPRRRVNIFGEELEKALKDKFQVTRQTFWDLHFEYLGKQTGLSPTRICRREK